MIERILRMTPNYFRPIGTKSVVQQVIDRLTDAMIHKSLRPGEKIPTEIELASTFGVGRNSVREAIKILVSLGVLEIRRPEGTFVAQGFSDHMIDPLLYGIILDDTESMDSLKELREWVDVGLLHLAMRKATEEDIALLEERLQEMKRAMRDEDVPAICAADDAFHDAIAQAAHNALFAKIANVARILISEIRRRTIRNMTEMGKLADMDRVHEDLLNMIKHHRPDYGGLDDAETVVQGYFYEYDVLKDTKGKD